MSKEIIDFMVIGGIRCGTTTLWKLLKQHPQLAFPYRKELHYFDSNKYDGHIQSYQKLLPQTRTRLVGEATPTYLYYKSAPEQIKIYASKTKFIILLRNPVDRTYSHFLLQTRRGLAYKNINNLINKTNYGQQIINWSEYHRYLKHWFQYYPRKQFLIIQSEEYYKNPQTIFNKVCKFLGIKEYNADLKVRINSLQRKYPFPDEARNKLKQHFKYHNNKLYQLLNVNYGWE